MRTKKKPTLPSPTPGSWLLRHEVQDVPLGFEGIEILATDAGNTELNGVKGQWILARVGDPAFWDRNLYDEPAGEYWERDLANARMMAAGREMLEALEAQDAYEVHYDACQQCKDGYSLCDEGIELLDSAIALRRDAKAKARGINP